VFGTSRHLVLFQVSVDSTRHLVARARAHVQERRPRYYASRQQREELAQRFFAAAEQGDLPALEKLLAQDAVLHGDGCGKAPALLRPVNRQHVPRVPAAAVSALARAGGVRFHVTEVNGQPDAMVFDTQDLLVGVMALDIAGGQIQTIRSIVNPDKL
jgi:RNA polymerase sigma-70 factor (ECF subfamily)